MDKCLNVILSLCKKSENVVKILKLDGNFYTAIKFLYFDTDNQYESSKPKLKACLKLFTTETENE